MTVARIAIEQTEYAQHLGSKHERLTAEASDALLPDPIRPHDPLLIARDVFSQDSFAGRAYPADLPDTQGKSPKRAIQPRPILAPIRRTSGACRKMETARLIRALGTHRTSLADVSWADEPDARQRHGRLRCKALDDLRQDRSTDRSAATVNATACRASGFIAPPYNENSMLRDDISFLQRNLVAEIAI